MNEQNLTATDSALIQSLAVVPGAADTVQKVQADSSHTASDSLVVYKIVNGERAGEEIVLAPCPRADMHQAMVAQESTNGAKSVHFEFDASGTVVTILVVAVLLFLGYALSVVRSIALGGKCASPCNSAAPAAAPAASAPSALAAAVAAPVAAAPAQIHPGLSNEKLAVLLAVAAAETLGPNTHVVKFKPMNQSDWTWAVQGRTDLHSNRLV